MDINDIALGMISNYSLSVSMGRSSGGGNEWQHTPVFLPGESPRQRGLGAAVHGVSMSCTRLSDFTSTVHFHPLEKEMATYSSILAWRIPQTEEPGGLKSKGT